MQIPPFTLYGLIGCQHCVNAEQYLKLRNIPFIAMYINGDPIIGAGIKAVTKADEAPVLVCRISNEIITGFKESDYERVTKLYYSGVGAGPISIFAGEQQSVARNTVQAETAAAS